MRASCTRFVRRVLPSILVASGAAAVPSSGPLSAQEIASPYRYIERKQEVGPFVGVMNASSGRFGFAPRGGPVIGARWGIELAGPLSLEGVAGFVDGERDVIDPGRDEGDRVVGVAEARVVTADLRLKFTLTGPRSWHGLAPFVVFGGGIAVGASGTSPADAQLLAADRFDFGTSFFGTLGAGSRWFVTERWALRGDAVFSLWKIPTPPGFSDPERDFQGVEQGEWTRGVTLSVALLYRW